MDAALESKLKDCIYTRIREHYLRISVLAAEAPCVKAK
jgi:hypothetical protein